MELEAEETCRSTPTVAASLWTWPIFESGRERERDGSEGASSTKCLNGMVESSVNCKSGRQSWGPSPNHLKQNKQKNIQKEGRMQIGTGSKIGWRWDENNMENVKLGMLDGFLTKSHQKSLKSLFRRSNSSKSNGGGDGGQDSPSSSALNSPKPIPQLSPFANSVVSRCSKCLPLFSSLTGFQFYAYHYSLYMHHACYVIWVTLVFHHPKSKNKHGTCRLHGTTIHIIYTMLRISCPFWI